MAFQFSNISDSIEKHPVMASVIFGVAVLGATYLIMNRNKSKSANTSTQSVCTDSNGNAVDCNTGLPIGTSGGFSLQPINSNSDILSALGNLQLAIQNLMNPTGTTNTGTTNSGKPTISGGGIVPPRGINPPGKYSGQPIINPTPITQHNYVTVAQWSATNTPWNSTLWGIAHHYNESLSAIESKNPQIKNPNLIYAGEKVYY